MSDKLKQYARHVQHALEADPTVVSQKYTWCLEMVRTLLENAEEQHRRALRETKDYRAHSEAVKATLVEMIKPLARKAG